MVRRTQVTTRDGGGGTGQASRFQGKEDQVIDIAKERGRLDEHLAEIPAEQKTEEELFTRRYYAFTGSSDLATYVNSATASHYRSAELILIRRWWKAKCVSSATQSPRHR